MQISLPQTYLIALGSLLFVIAILLGRQVFKTRKDEINLVNLEKEQVKDPKNVATLYELGSVQLRKRLYPQATISLKKALNQLSDEPEEAKALIENALGFSLAAQDKFKEAITHYKNALKSRPEYPVALNNLAFAKQKTDENKEAYDLYLKVLEIDPRNKTAKKQIEKLNKVMKNGSRNLSYKKGF